jgi:hypothetical protein
MNATSPSSKVEDLLQLLAQWQDLSATECDAIRQEDWSALEAAQSAKAQLQQRIDLCQPDLPPWSSGRSPRLPATVMDLAVRLQSGERENARLLASKLEEYRDRMASLDSSVRSLRQVHRAYGSAGSAAWQWYS